MVWVVLREQVSIIKITVYFVKNCAAMEGVKPSCDQQCSS